MSRYIDAEKLIAEIERRYHKAVDESKYMNSAKFVRNELENLREFAYSLQQEQPQVADASKMEQLEVDLEKAIEDYYGNIPDDEDKVKAARHFFELGKTARKEK